MLKEALQKGIRSIEISRFGLGADGKDKVKDEALKNPTEALLKLIRDKIRIPNDERLFYLRYALRAGLTVDEIFTLSRIDRWFLQCFFRFYWIETLFDVCN